MATPFLSEIRAVAFNFPPKGWALCNGQLLPINQNQGLFSLLGTTYGGDGRVNFGLPDLRSRVPIHAGNGFTLGQRGGEERHTLSLPEMAQHTHGVTATTSVANAGNASAGNIRTVGNHAYVPAADVTNPVAMASATVAASGAASPASHDNRQPYLVLSFIIALQGIFPSQI